MTPADVEVLRHNGHTILVESEAGIGSGYDNTGYRERDIL